MAEARVFVADAAAEASAERPAMTPGRWYEASPGVWEEKKADGTVTQYTDDGPTGTAGSTTVRLKLEKDGVNCEVYITSLSALIFVNGAFSGEYVGHWEVGGLQQEPPVETRVAFVEGPPPIPGERPRRQSNNMAPYDGTPGHNKAGAQQMGQQMPGQMPAAEPVKVRPKKAENCDQSPAMVEKLYQAAKSGDYGTTKRFLDIPVDPDCIGAEGLTPLLIAAQLGKVTVVEALIAAGADVNIGVNGNTPMIAAFQKGRKDVLRVLFGAAFSSLEHAVGPGGAAVSGQNISFSGGADEEVSPMALAELRDVTAKLASLNRPEEKDEELEQVPAEEEQPINEGQDERMREEVVRETMRQLLNASKAGAEAPSSP